MLAKRWPIIFLCILMVFSACLGACGGGDNAPDIPDDPQPGGDDQDNGGDILPPQTRVQFYDLEPIPYSIMYMDKDHNLVQLDLNDKTEKILATDVGYYVPDWDNRRLALAILDTSEEIEGQGVAQIVTYSLDDGSTEYFLDSYLGYGLQLSPNGRFLTVFGGIYGMDLCDLETGVIYDASDFNLLAAFDESPVWSPSGMCYAVPRIFIYDLGGPQGVYLVDPVTREDTLVYRAEDKMARPHSWIDEHRLLIQIESEPFQWMNEDGSEGNARIEDGDYWILDINTLELTATSAPEPWEWYQKPRAESPDGAWVIYEDWDGKIPVKKTIRLWHKETNTLCIIGRGSQPHWVTE